MSFKRFGFIPLSLGILVPLGLGLAAPPDAKSSAPVIMQIAKQFDQHPLIMIGELHKWQELHAFIREMIRDREFVCRVNDIVVEFGNSRLQALADTYISGGNLTEAQIQSIWRETAVPTSWNSPVYQQLLDAVREINRKHLCDHPIRIVLADPPLDWSKIKTAQQLVPFTDRDGTFAEVVEREVLARHRRAFLLAGQYHVVKQLPEGDDDGPRVAQIIEQKHPGALFNIVAAVPEVAEALHLPPAPSLTVVRGSGLEQADFSLIATGNPHKKWPPFVRVVDAILFVGEHHDANPSPTIYLDPTYQRELRRRATIIKEWNGQDFMPAIDALVKEAHQSEKKP